jgi:AcrR family transcriptional regulator
MQVVEKPRVSRATKASQITEALIDAALYLFERDGFDATHTDRIAERAGVSPRTFFRYFPTKEAVVFHRDYTFMRGFTDAYRGQPKVMSDFEALRSTFVGLSAGLHVLRARLETYRAAVDSSPVLIGHEHMHIRDHETTVATAIAERRGVPQPNEQCQTLASISLVLYGIGLRRWLNGPSSLPLARLINEEFLSLPQLVAAS